MCEYSQRISEGKTESLICKISNEFCLRCRWCITKNDIVMTDGYFSNGCKIKNDFENNQKGGVKMDEIIEELVSLEENMEVNKNIVPERPKKKKNKNVDLDNSKSIICDVNYNVPKKNKTSIRYKNNDTICSVFIDGVYNGKLEVTYIGDVFNSNNIKSIKSL